MKQEKKCAQCSKSVRESMYFCSDKCQKEWNGARAMEPMADMYRECGGTGKQNE